MTESLHLLHAAEYDSGCVVCRRLDAVRGDSLRPTETDDEPWYGVLQPVEDYDDPIAPARGCLTGTLIALVLWVAFFGGLALVIAWAVRR